MQPRKQSVFPSIFTSDRFYEPSKASRMLKFIIFLAIKLTEYIDIDLKKCLIIVIDGILVKRIARNTNKIQNYWCWSEMIKLR